MGKLLIYKKVRQKVKIAFSVEISFNYLGGKCSEALLVVIHAMIASQIDYCNVLYIGLMLKTCGSFNWSRMRSTDSDEHAM